MRCLAVPCSADIEMGRIICSFKGMMEKFHDGLLKTLMIESLSSSLTNHLSLGKINTIISEFHFRLPSHKDIQRRMDFPFINLSTEDLKLLVERICSRARSKPATIADTILIESSIVSCGEPMGHTSNTPLCRNMLAFIP